MNQRGRKLSTKLMVVDPDYQGSRFEMPEPPAHLGKPEQALWRDLTAEHDFATTASLELLIKAMEAHMRFRLAHEQVKKDGMLIKGPHGPRSHPLLVTERVAGAQYVAALKKLKVLPK